MQAATPADAQRPMCTLFASCGKLDVPLVALWGALAESHIESVMMYVAS
jgi:hypothetical protein